MTAMSIPESTLLTDNQPEKLAGIKDDAIAQHSTVSSSALHGALAPIGLFDSGVGGLSVYQHLKQALPNERFVYYADTLNVPYGPRSSEEIKQLSLAAVDWLVAAGCKLIVIACNSASAHALQVAREQYPDVPIVGLVPALKPAVLSSRNKKVAVLATKATLDGTLLNKVIDEYADPAGVEVIKWFDPDLVPWVEAGMPLESKTATQLTQQLRQFAEQQVDYLVLGCTHYPFFRAFISDEIAAQGLGIEVLDSGAAIAARVKEVLSTQNKLLPMPDMDASDADSGHNAAAFHIDIIGSALSIPVNGDGGQQAATATPAETPQPASSITAGRDKEALSFYVTDPQADLNEVALLLHRLLE